MGAGAPDSRKRRQMRGIGEETFGGGGGCGAAAIWNPLRRIETSLPPAISAI